TARRSGSAYALAGCFLGRASLGAPGGGSRLQLIEQRLSLLKIARVEPFRKPSIDRREECQRLLPPALTQPKRGKVFRGPQFQGPGVLAFCYLEGLLERWLYIGARCAADRQRLRF